LLDLKGENAGFLRNLKTLFSSDLPEFIPELNNFIGVVDLLTAMGIKYQIDIASGRGFEYYTGMIFQMFADNNKLGGGGRYDALIPLMGGKNTPASGFALQMNTLMNLIEMPSLTKSEANKILITGSDDEPKSVKSAYRIAEGLRKAGFIVNIQLGNEDKKNYKWVIDLNDAKTIKDVLKMSGENGGR
jgi:histidyl-tRNA synthetase